MHREYSIPPNYESQQPNGKPHMHRTFSQTHLRSPLKMGDTTSRFLSFLLSLHPHPLPVATPPPLKFTQVGLLCVSCLLPNPAPPCVSCSFSNPASTPCRKNNIGAVYSRTSPPSHLRLRLWFGASWSPGPPGTRSGPRTCDSPHLFNVAIYNQQQLIHEFTWVGSPSHLTQRSSG